MKATPDPLRKCIQCAELRIRSVEEIGEELYLAPLRIEQSTASGSMRWLTLSLQAKRLADEIRGVCRSCSAAMTLEAALRSSSKGG